MKIGVVLAYLGQCELSPPLDLAKSRVGIQDELEGVVVVPLPDT